MQMNERLQKRLKLIVVGAVTVFFILVIVLSFQLAIRSNRNGEEAALQAEQEWLLAALEQAEGSIIYFDTWEFVLQWARENLGIGLPNQSIVYRG